MNTFATHRPTHDYDATPLRRFTARDLSNARKLLASFPPTAPQGRKLFAVEFGSEFVLFTERLTDVLVIMTFSDKHVELHTFAATPIRKPDGAEVIRPTEIADAEWDELARVPCYRRTFACPPAGRGAELAATGASVSAGREMRTYSSQFSTGNPSILWKSRSRVTSTAPSARAVAAIQRSFSSSTRPRRSRVILISA